MIFLIKNINDNFKYYLNKLRLIFYINIILK